MPVHASSDDSGVYTSIQELIDWRHVAQRQGESGRLLSLFELPGRKRSNSNGHGTEFGEMRAWQGGDSARSIDWRVSARRGELMMRQHLDERECPLYLLVDQRPAMFFGSGSRFKSLTAVHVAAVLAWAAFASGDRIGGLVFGQQMSPLRCAKGKHNLLQLLHTLAIANQALDAESQEKFCIDEALDAAIAAVPPGARIAVISDFDNLASRSWPRLDELAAKARLALFRVGDPLEEQLQLRGNLAISDGLLSQTIRFDRRLLENYRSNRARADARLQQWCEESVVSLHRLSTEQAADASLNEALSGSLSGGAYH